jgi:hypothetical protein
MLIQDQINLFQYLLYINIWWAWVGTMSDSATLHRHNTTKRLPTPVLGYDCINSFVNHCSEYICEKIFYFQ